MSASVLASLCHLNAVFVARSCITAARMFWYTWGEAMVFRKSAVQVKPRS